MACKFSLLDDDGVLVVSTIRQMESWKSRDFGYEYPEELIAEMQEGRAFAWEVDGEDECDIELRFTKIENANEESRLGPFLLTALEDDQVVVMPYSQFTFAADCAAGEVKDIERLSFRIPIKAGAHHLYVTSTGEAEWLLEIVSDDGTALLEIEDVLPAFA